MPNTGFTLTTPLPAADLLLEGMTASDGLSTLGEMQLEVSSPKADIDPAALLGKPLTVKVLLEADEPRYFHGIVSRFSVGASRGRFFGYHLTAQPWLWLLTRTSDCRIFQDRSVPEIVEAVFKDHRAAHYAFNLFRTYPLLNYCVQYRESDYNFVARLLESAGIYWFFEHDASGQHLLKLVDSFSVHDPLQHTPTLPYFANSGQKPPFAQYLSHWGVTQHVKPGKVALTSYDFERPGTQLGVDSASEREHEHADYEVFDFQGDYRDATVGAQAAQDRLDEQQAQFHLARASGNAHWVETGRTFTLNRHPHDNQNGEYLVTSTTLRLRCGGHESLGAQAGGLECQLVAMPAAQQFRPLRRAPKPFMQGPQTAVVVGPAGDEIFTDEYGRVKLQFHWDRYGKKNEKSSCWVRVSTPWAGKSFGFVQIPRIGQEVVVDFLEGDPDQPIVTGRVYNADQMPPWKLPANMTQSGVLTRSSKGGSYGNANALRFEDKKGSEQLWLHAEKNQDIEVENDETHWVGHDRSKTIDHDEAVCVKHDRTETVDHNETITIGNDRTESVGGNESVSVSKSRTMDVSDNETLSVGKDREHTVGKNETTAVGDNLKATVGKNAELEVGEKRETKIGKDDLLQVGKKLYIEAGDEITLKTGDASITLKKDGTVQIKGKDITVSGSGKIGIKASGNIVVKGSKIADN